MGGASHLVTWPLRQWRRAQLALDLLRQYEYEDEHRIDWAEAMQRLVESGHLARDTRKSGVAEWRKAVEARAEKYSSG